MLGPGQKTLQVSWAGVRLGLRSGFGIAGAVLLKMKLLRCVGTWRRDWGEVVLLNVSVDKTRAVVKVTCAPASVG